MGILIFLSSGLFLGWSLGANDASNVFGTAVATRMIKFRTAAIICSLFLVLGACISGAGAAHTLGKLGAVNSIAGAFMVACSAAITVFWMTKLELPVSTSQAIVGAIIGWNFFSGSLTNYQSLAKIVMTWVMCPILAAFFSIVFFKLLEIILKIAKLHMFRLDAYTRTGLIFVGAFGSYSLGANNIANVMGVFVPVAPFNSFTIFNIEFSNTQQLFFLGAIAIAVGVFTYSYKVMSTVGSKLVKLTPQAALVVVFAQAAVLFIFASKRLQTFLLSYGLPAFPLVPVSSSQAVIGAVLGIGIVKGAKNIQWKILVNIAWGWITTPLIAGIITYVALFFLQNVFDQQVYRYTPFKIDKNVIEYAGTQGIKPQYLQKIQGKKYETAQKFLSVLEKTKLTPQERQKLLYLAEIDCFHITKDRIAKIKENMFSYEQIREIKILEGRKFQHKWEFYRALINRNSSWKDMQEWKFNRLYNIFRIPVEKSKD